MASDMPHKYTVQYDHSNYETITNIIRCKRWSLLFYSSKFDLISRKLVNMLQVKLWYKGVNAIYSSFSIIDQHHSVFGHIGRVQSCPRVHFLLPIQPKQNSLHEETRSSAIAERPRDASCQLKSCQLRRNSAETTYTTSPDQIDGMKLEI